MLAARDQENLVHGHQQAATSKSLNQGARQLAPKTPGNKAKTPFKIPLNDENGPGIFGAGKSALKTNGKGNENLVTGAKKSVLGGDKDAFKTPMGPRNRAPLGLKTTNAKTKAFHIPPPPSVEDAPDNGQQKSASASARKGRPRVSHANMEKLDIHQDLDKLKEMDIEYMPPPAKNLPDYPDDIHETNLTPWPGGKGILQSWWQDRLYAPDHEGLSYVDRQEIAHQEELERADREMYAQAHLDRETLFLPCTCERECPGEICKRNLAAKKAAEEKYQKIMKEIDLERRPWLKPEAPKPATTKPPSSKPAAKKSLQAKGPLTVTSKSAASLLSQPKPSRTIPKPPTTKPRLPFSNIASRKQTPAPTNPSPMRHTAATLASKTTIGRSAGRATSATYRKNGAPAKSATEGPDTSLPPATYIARYGEPKVGSRMWDLCLEAGLLYGRGQEDEEVYKGPSLEEILREGAEEEFVLEMPE